MPAPRRGILPDSARAWTGDAPDRICPMSSMTANSEMIASVVGGVRERFLERLGDRCLEIETLMLAIDEQGLQQRLIDEIAGRAHKTAGVAPTLGFEDLGKVALDVEGRLSKPLDADGWADCRQRIETLLDEMELALDMAP